MKQYLQKGLSIYSKENEVIPSAEGNRAFAQLSSEVSQGKAEIVQNLDLPFTDESWEDRIMVLKEMWRLRSNLSLKGKAIFDKFLKLDSK